MLFVCTGNICRSPLAEGVFAKLVDEAGLGDRIAVDSAGIIDYHRGEPPDGRATRAAGRRGIELDGQRARVIRLRDFRDFDYIVALDQSHHRQLLARRPEGAPARLRLLLEFAPQLGTLDVPDPYYGDAAAFEHALELIEAGAAGLLRALREPCP